MKKKHAALLIGLLLNAPNSFAASQPTVPLLGPLVGPLLVGGGGFSELSGGAHAFLDLLALGVPNSGTLPGLAADGLPALQDLVAGGANTITTAVGFSRFLTLSGNSSVLPELKVLPGGSLGVPYVTSLPTFGPAVVRTLESELNLATFQKLLPALAVPK